MDMDLIYLCGQIDDELHGAKDYIKRAIEIKPLNQEFAKNFAQMAEAEKEHALKIYSMLNTYAERLESGYREMPSEMRILIETTRKTFNEEMEKYIGLSSAYQKA